MDILININFRSRSVHQETRKQNSNSHVFFFSFLSIRADLLNNRKRVENQYFVRNILILSFLVPFRLLWNKLSIKNTIMNMNNFKRPINSWIEQSSQSWTNEKSIFCPNSYHRSSVCQFKMNSKSCTIYFRFIWHSYDWVRLDGAKKNNAHLACTEAHIRIA